LAVYGIGCGMVNTAEAGSGAAALVVALRAAAKGNAFAIVNLADLPMEAMVAQDSALSKLPIIEVPQKAKTSGFNDTSNKVYSQTQAAEAVAFVGVQSAQNAAHLAARILGIHSADAYGKVVLEHSKLAAAVMEKDAKLHKEVAEGKSVAAQ